MISDTSQDSDTRPKVRPPYLAPRCSIHPSTTSDDSVSTWKLRRSGRNGVRMVRTAHKRECELTLTGLPGLVESVVPLYEGAMFWRELNFGKCRSQIRNCRRFRQRGSHFATAAFLVGRKNMRIAQMCWKNSAQLAQLLETVQI